MSGIFDNILEDLGFSISKNTIKINSKEQKQRKRQLECMKKRNVMHMKMPRQKIWRHWVHNMKVPKKQKKKH